VNEQLSFSGYWRAIRNLGAPNESIDFFIGRRSRSTYTIIRRANGWWRVYKTWSTKGGHGRAAILEEFPAGARQEAIEYATTFARADANKLALRRMRAKGRRS